MAFSNNLRRLRREHSMSQDDLAKILGYKSFTTIQKWESDVSEPTVSIVKKIAEIFNVTMDELITDDEVNEVSYIEENLYKELGLLLRSARESAGLTLAEAANKMGVTTMTIQRYEKGERKISIEKIRLLCDAYSVSADDLMSLATSKAHSGVDTVSIISKDDTDSPTSAIVNIIQDESIETQMRIFDVVCDFLIANDYDRGRIAAYANMLAFGYADTQKMNAEIDQEDAQFKNRFTTHLGKDNIEPDGPHPYHGPDEDLVKAIAEKDTMETLRELEREAKAKEAARDAKKVNKGRPAK